MGSTKKFADRAIEDWGKANKSLYEGVMVPKALNGAETCGMRSDERRNVNVLGMKFFKVWLECHEWIEYGMKRCVGELE